MTQLASTTLLGADARAWLGDIRVSQMLSSITATPDIATEDDTELEQRVTRTKAVALESSITLEGRFRGDGNSDTILRDFQNLDGSPKSSAILSLAVGGDRIGERMRVYLATGTGFSFTAPRTSLQTWSINGVQSGGYIDGPLRPPRELTGFQNGSRAITAGLFSSGRFRVLNHGGRSSVGPWRDFRYETGYQPGDLHAFFIQVVSVQRLATAPSQASRLPQLDISTLQTNGQRTALDPLILTRGTNTNRALAVRCTEGDLQGFSVRINVPTVASSDPVQNALVNMTAVMVRSSSNRQP